jgi:DNA oxidative demethylase
MPDAMQQGFYTATMPRTGRPFGPQMTNLGPLGWFSDKDRGYRYEATHPVTGLPWPDMPPALLLIWEAVSNYAKPPEACLVNYYRATAKLSLHIDGDEEDRVAPVVSISLGDTAVFRIGGPRRDSKTSSVRLTSGDVMVLGGTSRNFYHGIDRIISGSSTLVPGGGRINLTMRVVR